MTSALQMRLRGLGGPRKQIANFAPPSDTRPPRRPQLTVSTGDAQGDNRIHGKVVHWRLQLLSALGVDEFGGTSADHHRRGIWAAGQ